MMLNFHKRAHFEHNVPFWSAKGTSFIFKIFVTQSQLFFVIFFINATFVRRSDEHMEFYYWIAIQIILPILIILYLRKEMMKIADGKPKQFLSFSLGLAMFSTIVLALALGVFLLVPSLIPIAFDTIETAQRYTVLGCILMGSRSFYSLII